MQRAEPSKKAHLAAHKQGSKRAKVLHEKDAFLVPVSHEEDFQAAQTRKAGLLRSSASTLSSTSTMSRSQSCAGSTIKDAPDVAQTEEPLCRSGINAMHGNANCLNQSCVLQAKGVALHFVHTASLEPIGARAIGCSVMEIASVLPDVVIQGIHAAQELAAEGQNIVAVHIKVSKLQSCCHIICHH